MILASHTSLSVYVLAAAFLMLLPDNVLRKAAEDGANTWAPSGLLGVRNRIPGY